MLPSLLADIELFRKIAVAAAVLGVIGSAFMLAKKRATPRDVLVPLVATIGMAAFSYRLENMVDWRLTIFGLMTLFVVYYLQDGIVGFLPADGQGRGAYQVGRGWTGVDPFARAEGGKAGERRC
jgi:hypothetical protein